MKKKKRVDSFKLKVIEGGRISKTQMKSVYGAENISCGEYVKCAHNQVGKSSCVEFSKCGWFSKNSCNEKLWLTNVVV